MVLHAATSSSNRETTEAASTKLVVSPQLVIQVLSSFLIPLKSPQAP